MWKCFYGPGMEFDLTRKNVMSVRIEPETVPSYKFFINQNNFIFLSLLYEMWLHQINKTEETFRNLYRCRNF